MTPELPKTDLIKHYGSKYIGNWKIQVWMTEIIPHLAALGSWHSSHWCSDQLNFPQMFWKYSTSNGYSKPTPPHQRQQQQQPRKKNNNSWLSFTNCTLFCLFWVTLPGGSYHCVPGRLFVGFLVLSFRIRGLEAFREAQEQPKTKCLRGMFHSYPWRIPMGLVTGIFTDPWFNHTQINHSWIGEHNSPMDPSWDRRL